MTHARRLNALLALAFLACGADPLHELADPPDAGSSVVVRDPPPDPGCYPREEVCDGLDSDCNGEIDDIALRFYWPADAPPVDFGGECSPGVVVCDGGRERIVGLVLPAPTDTCGDGRDNDCDGLTDEVDDPGGWLVAMAVDQSGSMGLYRGPVNEALCGLDTRSPHAHSLALYGGDGPTSVASAWGEPLCDSLVIDGGSSELTYRAVNTLLALEPWPDTTTRRVVVVVTDEPPQHTATSDGTAELVDLCLEQRFAVGVVTLSAYAHHWTGVTDACGGWISSLSQAPEDMFAAFTGDALRCVEEE